MEGIFKKNVSFCGNVWTKVKHRENSSRYNVIVLRQHTVAMEAYLSLQSADEDLLSLQLLLLLQQRLLQLLHPQLAVLAQLLLQAQLGSSLRGRLQGLPQLQTRTHTHLLQTSTKIHAYLGSCCDIWDVYRLLFESQ